jgi:hypothetical protein
MKEESRLLNQNTREMQHSSQIRADQEQDPGICHTLMLTVVLAGLKNSDQQPRQAALLHASAQWHPLPPSPTSHPVFQASDESLTHCEKMQWPTMPLEMSESCYWADSAKGESSSRVNCEVGPAEALSRSKKTSRRSLSSAKGSLLCFLPPAAVNTKGMYLGI